MKKENKKEEENKTLIKLLNNYADSHNLLLKENENLKHELRNLKSTLKINKELLDKIAMNESIDGLFDSSNGVISKSCINNKYPISNNINNSSNNVNKNKERYSNNIYNKINQSDKNLSYINNNKLICSSLSTNNEQQKEKDSTTIDDNIRVKNSFKTSLFEIKNNNTDNLNKLPDIEILTMRIVNLKEENCNLNYYIEEKNKNYNEILEKFKVIQNNASQEINLLKSEKEKLETKIFLLENKLSKYNNIKKEKKRNKHLKQEEFTREVLVSDPAPCLNQLNSDLEILKNSALELLGLLDNYREKIKDISQLKDLYKSENFELKKKLDKLKINLNEIKKREDNRPENNINSSFSFDRNKNFYNMYNVDINDFKHFKLKKQIKDDDNIDLKTLKLKAFKELYNNNLLNKNIENELNESKSVMYDLMLKPFNLANLIKKNKEENLYLTNIECLPSGMLLMNKLLYENNLTYKELLDFKQNINFYNYISVFENMTLEYTKIKKEKLIILKENNQLKIDLKSKFNKTEFNDICLLSDKNTALNDLNIAKSNSLKTKRNMNFTPIRESINFKRDMEWASPSVKVILEDINKNYDFNNFNLNNELLSSDVYSNINVIKLKSKLCSIEDQVEDLSISD